MRQSAFYEGYWWDVVVSRKAPTSMTPVWLVRYDSEEDLMEKILLCQVVNTGRFGWTVVVAGHEISGLRLVEGFKQRWQAIKYAISLWPTGRVDDDRQG